jgi:hypothetical protein
MPEPTKNTGTAASSASAPAAAPAPAATVTQPPEKRVYVVRNRIAGTLDGKRDPRRGDTLRLTADEAASLGPAVEPSR